MVNKYSPTKSELGFVSIIVASVLMVIMTLVTIGFTQIMQREQRQALDRQLNTQAYYAAETGINDFALALRAYDEDPTNPDYSAFGEEATKEKFDCDTTSFPSINEGRIDGEDGNISYTCLQYDLDPTTLRYDNGSIQTNQSKIVPVISSNEDNIRFITIAWSHFENQFGDFTDLNTCASGRTVFPASRPDSVPVMRLDVLRINRDGSVSQAGAISDSLNLYLNPQTGTCGVSTTSYTEHNDANEKGKIVQVACDDEQDERQCSMTITMNPAELGGAMTNKYILRMRSIYANANVTISAGTTIDPTQSAELVGAQVLVDSTGKANDVLRRIQVRLPAEASIDLNYDFPEPVFQSNNGFCKIISTYPPGSPPPNQQGFVSLNRDSCN